MWFLCQVLILQFYIASRNCSEPRQLILVYLPELHDQRLECTTFGIFLAFGQWLILCLVDQHLPEVNISGTQLLKIWKQKID
jgi:hypothetical protein